eukprot:c32631_g1_i1.p2 GENE.c32631_g1_i1~~c32631_g1_i1.p2  ORF type:complete len:386 (-),score=89.32 c32631_g1_i1:1419-2576(-)
MGGYSGTMDTLIKEQKEKRYAELVTFMAFDLSAWFRDLTGNQSITSETLQVSLMCSDVLDTMCLKLSPKHQVTFNQVAVTHLGQLDSPHVKWAVRNNTTQLLNWGMKIGVRHVFHPDDLVLSRSLRNVYSTVYRFIRIARAKGFKLVPELVRLEEEIDNAQARAQERLDSHLLQLRKTDAALGIESILEDADSEVDDDNTTSDSEPEQPQRGTDDALDNQVVEPEAEEVQDQAENMPEMIEAESEQAGDQLHKKGSIRFAAPRHVPVRGRSHAKTIRKSDAWLASAATRQRAKVFTTELEELQVLGLAKSVEAREIDTMVEEGLANMTPEQRSKFSLERVLSGQYLANSHVIVNIRLVGPHALVRVGKEWMSLSGFLESLTQTQI